MVNRQKKILIVDDVDFVLSKIKKAFDNTPYEVSTVNDAEKAYEMIENDFYQIVITDILMPDLAGLTLLKKIKQYNGMIQVIILMQEISINNTIDAFRYGAVDIFFKSTMSIDEIVKSVDFAAGRLDRVHAILGQISNKK